MIIGIHYFVEWCVQLTAFLFHEIKQPNVVTVKCLVEFEEWTFHKFGEWQFVYDFGELDL